LALLTSCSLELCPFAITNLQELHLKLEIDNLSIDFFYKRSLNSKSTTRTNHINKTGTKIKNKVNTMVASKRTKFSSSSNPPSKIHSKLMTSW
jgi:hypothetical protein